MAFGLLKEATNFGLGKPPAKAFAKVITLNTAVKINFLNIGNTKIHELNGFFCDFGLIYTEIV